MNIIKKLFCCGVQNDIYLEMHKFNCLTNEKQIIKFFEKHGINDYSIDWQTDILPCEIQYLLSKIKEDLCNNCLPEKVNIVIQENSINISYDNNPFRDSSIFFNNFD